MIIRLKKPRGPLLVDQTGRVMNEEELDVSSFSNPLYSTWGKVLKRDSTKNKIDVQLQNGLELRGVDVRSLEWAGADSTDGYGERDLPPVNCKVLLLFPDGILENAFVLCSALDLLGTVGQKQKQELLVSGKENEHLRIRKGKRTHFKINGAELIVNADGSIEVNAATGKDIKLGGATVIGANDLVSCIFSGAIHCTDALKKVKVP